MKINKENVINIIKKYKYLLLHLTLIFNHNKIIFKMTNKFNIIFHKNLSLNLRATSKMIILLSSLNFFNNLIRMIFRSIK